MPDDERKWDQEDAPARIDELDNEDLSIEELLDIEEKIEERAEAYERQAEALTGILDDAKLSLSERKRNLAEKERITEALETFEAQKMVVRAKLSELGYDVGETEND